VETVRMLVIEFSCDEAGSAVVEDGHAVLFVGR
jgi:hypothetical protein